MKSVTSAISHMGCFLQVCFSVWFRGKPKGRPKPFWSATVDPQMSARQYPNWSACSACLSNQLCDPGDTLLAGWMGFLQGQPTKLDQPCFLLGKPPPTNTKARMLVSLLKNCGRQVILPVDRCSFSKGREGRAICAWGTTVCKREDDPPRRLPCCSRNRIPPLPEAKQAEHGAL